MSYRLFYKYLVFCYLHIIAVLKPMQKVLKRVL